MSIVQAIASFFAAIQSWLSYMTKKADIKAGKDAAENKIAKGTKDAIVSAARGRADIHDASDGDLDKRLRAWSRDDPR